MSPLGALDLAEAQPLAVLPTCAATPVPYARAKRACDIALSLLLLLVAFPFMLVVALLVKLTSKGPVFYVSDRVGLAGKTIRFTKFRTMIVDADRLIAVLKSKNEKDGPIFKMKDDPRITPIGRFLRKFSLDELPQLWSVLTGDMSMVGPRPPLPREVARYDTRAMRRLSVTPGITCYWQVMGRSNLTFEEWLALDLKYIDEMSFWTDVKILLRTPVAVFGGKGAY
jgi:exopolysaccharide biosynthesis polyprenyl glycosylphosphotransferase